MTSPPENITVECPQCKKSYQDWWRPSINRSLDIGFDDEYVDQASSATCNHCGHKIYLNSLVVQLDGTWVLSTDEIDDDDDIED